MKRLIVLALLISGCQPDYGHLQPEYEQLLEVKDTLKVRKEEVRQIRTRTQSTARQLRVVDSLILEYNKN